MLLKEAARRFNWKLNYGGIALMWRGWETYFFLLNMIFL
jgi:6-phosphogluconate dehydrogenase